MPLTVSDAILSEIGRIAVYQSHVEGQMGLFIRELLNLDEPKGNAVIAALRLHGLADLLEALLQDRFGANHRHVKRMKSIRKDLEDRARERNEVIHSMWAFGASLKPDVATRIRIRKSRSQGAARQATQVTSNQLRETAKGLEYLDWAISDMRVRVCNYERAT